MSSELRTYKSNNTGLWIALVVSAIIAMALAFYLTTTGHRQDVAEVAPPAAPASLAQSGQAPQTP